MPSGARIHCDFDCRGVAQDIDLVICGLHLLHHQDLLKLKLLLNRWCGFNMNSNMGVKSGLKLNFKLAIP